MYTRACTTTHKEKILANFCDEKGKLRIIIATTAFGMGIDCPNIRIIYHWGAPSTIEEYAQETGRAGRDNLPSKAILLHKTVGIHVTDEVKSYIANNSVCRLQLLYKQFLFDAHTSDSQNCCDICCKEFA
uniref:DNA 3'-5' helicase n=1 Tax=Amphimedon queenslandica TaxID=400682 RepID=A0A1X7TDL1_AMPQE